MSPASYLLKSPAQFFKWFTYAPTYRIVPLCLWVVIVRGWWYWYAATSLWELCSERSWRRYHWIVQYLVPAHLVIAIIYPCLHLHVRCSAQYGIETMNRPNWPRLLFLEDLTTACLDWYGQWVLLFAMIGYLLWNIVGTRQPPFDAFSRGWDGRTTVWRVRRWWTW